MSSEQKSFEHQWRSRFEKFATAHQDDAGIAGWSPTGLAARVRRFGGLWRRDATGTRWLDAGCGAGTYIRLLQERGAVAYGLDYSAVSVDKARDRCERAAGWLVGDATALPVRRACLDGALCFGVTQALSSSKQVVVELAQAVRPHGEVWIDGLNSWCVPHVVERAERRLRRRPTHVRYESPYRLRRIMQAAGLENVRIHWLPILPGRLQRYQKLVESRFVQNLLRFIPVIGALFSHSMIVSGTVPEQPVRR